MHKIETLPFEIMYDGKCYFLSVHVTAWRKLCVGYKVMDAREMENIHIFSNVIDAQYKPKLPYNRQSITDIMDVNDFNEAVEILEKRVNDALKFGYIEIA